ncbi:SdiA-regulated domain-containing protein [Photobacterium sagamiensis]|uniref:hypothetical protein n=1 Tax=Photobacterium sagamiensis TaxID=2910241 RepID=UPI003D12FE0B
MEKSPEQFPNGAYLVKFSNSEDLVDDNDLDYSKMAMVISLETRPKGSKNLIGGFRPLIQALEGIECLGTIDEANNNYMLASFWVVEPTDPFELEQLEHV